MGSKRTIDEYTIQYNIARYTGVRRVYNSFYKKFKLHNVDRLPNGRPVIIAANHQNALMDALSISCNIKQQTIFLARADIFKKPLIIKLLTIIKIKPIYRMRDGVENLQKNEEIFESTVDILRRKLNPLFIFPEGNHAGFRRLRQLTKGIFRIAFRAQEDYGDKPGVVILPVGLDYSHYRKFRSNLFVNFGEPIEVNEYFKEYEKDGPIGINKLRERLSSELKKVMIHIETKEYYDLFLNLRWAYTPILRKKLGLKRNSLENNFIADKTLIKKLDETLETAPDKIEDLNKEFEKYAEIRNKLNLRDWVFRKGKFSFILNIAGLLLSLVTLPITIAGLFNNWPHYFIPPIFVKKIKDPQFKSTANWGICTAILMIYYIIIGTLALIFIPWWWAKIAYLIFMYQSGLFAFAYRNYVVKTLAKIRFSFFKFRKNKDLLTGIESFRKITTQLDSICK